MNGRMDGLEPPDTTAIEAALDAYIGSERFIDDALSWSSTHAWKHPALIELIADYYAESPECHTVAEDIVDGADSL